MLANVRNFDDLNNEKTGCEKSSKYFNNDADYFHTKIFQCRCFIFQLADNVDTV
jgi:hypothetical protein